MKIAFIHLLSVVGFMTDSFNAQALSHLSSIGIILHPATY